MSKKKSGQGPLLYIYQPFTPKPSDHNMQEVYSNRREPNQNKLDEGPGQQGKRKQRKKELVPVEVSANESTVGEEASQPQESHSSFKRVKPFADMNLTERLDYLLHFPKVLPPVPCIFNTADESYQGFLTDYENNLVTIQLPDQTTKTIPESQLINVIMIGIKR